MHGAATRLGLIWLASPALPVGGFSYSEGLEAAVDAGAVNSEATAAGWLVAQLQLTVARADAVVLAQAARAWRAADLAAVERLNAWVLATRETSELRLQAEQMGRSLTEWLRNSAHAADARIARLAALAPAPSWPVGYALAGVLFDAGDDDLLLSFAFGWAENMVQAAMKAVPLGQAAAQRILTQLAHAIPGCMQAAAQQAVPQSFAPMLAVHSAWHETQYSRLFRS